MHAKLDRVGLIIGHAGSPNGRLNVCQRTRVPWKNTFCWSSGQKTYQRIIAPISSFSGGSPPFRGGYDRYCQGVSVSCVLGDQNQNRGRFPSF